LRRWAGGLVPAAGGINAGTDPAITSDSRFRRALGVRGLGAGHAQVISPVPDSSHALPVAAVSWNVWDWFSALFQVERPDVRPRTSSASLVNGTEIVVYSAKNAPKLPALRHKPAVALTIDTEVHPPRILLIRGRGELDVVELDVVESIPDEHLDTSGTYTMTPEQRIDLGGRHPIALRRHGPNRRHPTWAKLIDFTTTLPSAVEEPARQRDECQRT
jgi:hypothetical protein